MRIIEGGGLNSFRSMAYKAPTRETMNYINEYAGSFSNNVSTRVRDYFEQNRLEIAPLNFNEVRSRAVAAMRSLDHMFAPDVVQRLDRIDAIQHAPETMRRYVMANPVVRQRYYDQRLEGYYEKYIDPYPNRIGIEDPVYRSVMDGIVQEDEEGNCWYWDYDDTNGDDLQEQELTLEEKYAIIDTWETTNRYLEENGEDPTSVFNNNL